MVLVTPSDMDDVAEPLKCVTCKYDFFRLFS